MPDDWQRVGRNPTWDYKNEKEIMGVYVSKEENAGQNNSCMYHVQKTDGSIIGVWGNAVLDNRFRNIKIGDAVKIVYLGKTVSEKTGRSYHNFDVFRKVIDPQLPKS